MDRLSPDQTLWNASWPGAEHRTTDECHPEHSWKLSPVPFQREALQDRLGTSIFGTMGFSCVQTAAQIGNNFKSVFNGRIEDGRLWNRLSSTLPFDHTNLRRRSATNGDLQQIRKCPSDFSKSNHMCATVEDDHITHAHTHVRNKFFF